MAENVIEEAERELDTSPPGEAWPSASLLVHEPRPPDLSRLSEQQVIDLLRRIDSTRAHQEQIKELLDGAREHMKKARDSIWFAAMQTLDPGHRARLHACEQSAFALLQQIGEVYEPEGRRSPVE